MASPLNTSTTRSRQERLAELERERQLFSKSRARNNNINAELSSSLYDSSRNNSHNFDYSQQQSRVNNNNNNNNSNNFDFSTLNIDNNQDLDDSVTSDKFSELCFASSDLRSKIKTNKFGQQTFVERVPVVKTPTPPKRKTSANNVDPWSKLVSREEKSRIKYHSTDKTLMVLLEEERIKYIQLEQEYQNLLSHVQQLSETHHKDIKLKTHENEAVKHQLTTKLTTKNQECEALQKDLSTLLGKYKSETKSYKDDNERLERHLDKLQRLFAESDSQVAHQEKVIVDLEKSRREMASQIENKEVDVKKHIALYREKEVERMKEKESYMKMEVRVLQLDHHLAQKEEEIKTYKALIQKLRVECEESEQLKTSLSEARRDIENMTKREQKYMADNQVASQNQHKLAIEVDELSSQVRKYQHEIERLSSTNTLNQSELDQLKADEIKRKQDLQTLNSKLSATTNELEESKTLVQEFRNSLFSREKELGAARQSLEEVTREKDQLVTIRNQLMGELVKKDNENHSLDLKLGELSQKYDYEVTQKNDLKNQLKEKVAIFGENIKQLEDTIMDRDAQLEQLRKTEQSHRSALRSRDEKINNLESLNGELESQLSTTSHSLSIAQKDLLQIKQSAKKESLMLQERNNNLQADYESETSQLNVQISQKASQIQNMSNEAERYKQQCSTLSNDLFRAESKLSEHVNQSETHIRHLQAVVSGKEQELSLIGVKHSALVEQYKRLEEEVDGYKVATLQKDNDIGRLQQNVSELSRRLRGQVDLLLQGDGGSGGEYTPTGSRERRKSNTNNYTARGSSGKSVADLTLRRSTDFLNKRQSNNEPPLATSNERDEFSSIKGYEEFSRFGGIDSPKTNQPQSSSPQHR